MMIYYSDLSGSPDLTFKAYNFGKKIKDCDFRNTNVVCLEPGICENYIKKPDDTNPQYFTDADIESMYPNKCGSRSGGSRGIDQGGSKKYMIIGIIAAVLLLLLLCIIFYVMKRNKKKDESENEVKDDFSLPLSQEKQDNKDDKGSIEMEYSSVVNNAPVITASNIQINGYQFSENKDEIQSLENKNIVAMPLSGNNNTDINEIDNNSTINRSINNNNNNNNYNNNNNVDSNINTDSVNNFNANEGSNVNVYNVNNNNYYDNSNINIDSVNNTYANDNSNINTNSVNNINVNENTNIGNGTDISVTITPTQTNNTNINSNVNNNINPIPEIVVSGDNSSTNGSITGFGHNTVPINSSNDNRPSAKTLEMIQSREDNPEEEAPPSYNEANDSLAINSMSSQYPISPVMSPVLNGYGYNNVQNNQMSYISNNNMGGDMNVQSGQVIDTIPPTSPMLNGVSSSSMLNNNIMYSGNVGPMIYNNGYVNGSFDNNGYVNGNFDNNGYINGSFDNNNNYNYVYNNVNMNSLNRNYGNNNSNNNVNVSSMGLPLYNVYTVNNTMSNNLNSNVNNTNNNGQNP